jgi:hypothetical protein
MGGKDKNGTQSNQKTRWHLAAAPLVALCLEKKKAFFLNKNCKNNNNRNKNERKKERKAMIPITKLCAKKFYQRFIGHTMNLQV